jgi:hypothetical protein
MKTFGVVGEENKKSTRKKKCQKYDLLAGLFILFTKTARPSPGINWLSPKQNRK